MILKGTPTKEAKAEIETHPVILEIAISECSMKDLMCYIESFHIILKKPKQKSKHIQ